MPSSRCKQCNQPLVEIDHWGERLTGCPTQEPVSYLKCEPVLEHDEDGFPQLPECLDRRLLAEAA
jgi:hypothetical protein